MQQLLNFVRFLMILWTLLYYINYTQLDLGNLRSTELAIKHRIEIDVIDSNHIVLLQFKDETLLWQNCTTPPDHWDFGIWLGWMSISWDPSQLHAIPNPDHPPLRIFLTYQLFCTKKKCPWLKLSFQIFLQYWDFIKSFKIFLFVILIEIFIWSIQNSDTKKRNR